MVRNDKAWYQVELSDKNKVDGQNVSHFDMKGIVGFSVLLEGVYWGLRAQNASHMLWDLARS